MPAAISDLNQGAAGPIGVLICGHGSRNRLAVDEFAQLAERVRQQLAPVPVAHGYLDLEAVVTTLEQRPAQMDVILTGPSMPEPLMAMADQVTQLRRGF